jgi:hypothetical protein
MAYHVRQKGEEKESAVCNSFLNACKWCVKYADLIGDDFEIIRVEKRGRRTVNFGKEADYEVLP